MKNVEMAVEGHRLTITVDLSKEFGPSASGKVSHEEPSEKRPNQIERCNCRSTVQDARRLGRVGRTSCRRNSTAASENAFWSPAIMCAAPPTSAS